MVFVNHDDVRLCSSHLIPQSTAVRSLRLALDPFDWVIPMLRAQAVATVRLGRVDGDTDLADGLAPIPCVARGCPRCNTHASPHSRAEPLDADAAASESDGSHRRAALGRSFDSGAPHCTAFGDGLRGLRRVPLPHDRHVAGCTTAVARGLVGCFSLHFTIANNRRQVRADPTLGRCKAEPVRFAHRARLGGADRSGLSTICTRRL